MSSHPYHLSFLSDSFRKDQINLTLFSDYAEDNLRVFSLLITQTEMILNFHITSVLKVFQLASN